MSGLNVSEETNGTEPSSLPVLGIDKLHLLILYCVAYGAVFIVGLVGNMFVVVAVGLYPSMRNITNYFILSLAIADLLIIIFCLPATLMNNILYEWWLGNFLCKLSVWVNATTVCTSVYTLVAVTADRYCAICHTMKYNVWEKRYISLIIIPIWVVSGLLFVPWFHYFQIYDYPLPNTTLTARICVPNFPSVQMEKMLFLCINFLIAFLIPLIVITVCYAFIFNAIFRHKSLAVDHNAAIREQRIKMRVTNMMLTVIILFAVSWLPLYSLYTYLFFGGVNMETELGRWIRFFFRPVFQWLSLFNSCINPILYAYFSQKFRHAFQEILVLPCRRRYARVRQFARATMKRASRRTGEDYSDFYTNRSPQDVTEEQRSPRSLRNYDAAGRRRTPALEYQASQRCHTDTNHLLVPKRVQTLRTVRAGNSDFISRKDDPEESKPNPNTISKCHSHSDQGEEETDFYNPNAPFSPISSSLSVTNSPTFLLHQQLQQRRRVQEHLHQDSILNSLSPCAPVLTMRDLDISSLSPGGPSLSSGDQVGRCSASTTLPVVELNHRNGTATPCHLRFSQIRESTTI